MTDGVWEGFFIFDNKDYILLYLCNSKTFYMKHQQLETLDAGMGAARSMSRHNLSPLIAAVAMSILCSGCRDKPQNQDKPKLENVSKSSTLPETEIASLIPGLNQELSQEITKWE